MTDPDIQPALIQRLSDQTSGFVTVSDAWFMAPIDDLAAETPACFVYLVEDGAAADPVTLRPRQAVTLVYGVWLVCPREQFRRQRQQVRAALFGWVPTEYHEPLAYAKGHTSDLRGDTVWWLERWSVDTTLFT